MTAFPNSKPVAAGSNPRALAELFKMDLQDMFNQWNAEKPLRTGYPHASNILAIESEFCLRKLVFMACFPDEAEEIPSKPWSQLENARFKHGWVVHEKYQDILKRYGKVVYFRGSPELDLTHFDDTRLLYFSPDAIVEHCGEQMVVEIKGYKQETFDKLDESGPAPEAAHKQVNLYMHLLKLKHGLVLVENKNTQEIKVWCVEYDFDLYVPYRERMREFQKWYIKVKAGKEPPARKCEKSTDRLATKCEMCRFCFSR